MTSDETTDATKPRADGGHELVDTRLPESAQPSGDHEAVREELETLLGRRLFLGAAGTLALAGVGSIPAAAGADHDDDDTDDDHYDWVLEQNGTCYAITPLEGDDDAEDFYDWDEGSTNYSSEGTVDLQKADTSIVFLYKYDGEVYLVVVHERLDDDFPREDGFSASFTFKNLPNADAEWKVQDDLYDGDSNYDQWLTDDDPQVVHWTGRGGRTDGGVYGPLPMDTDLVIDPAFNSKAKLYEDYYDGEVDDWEVVSGSLDDPDYYALDMDTPIRIRTGTCGDDSEPEPTDSPLTANYSCALDGTATVRIYNRSDERVEVRDIDSVGDLMQGVRTLDPDQYLTISGVADGDYAVQAYEPGTNTRIGSMVEWTVDCDLPGSDYLDVAVYCNGGGSVDITNTTDRRVQVRDLDVTGDSDDLFDGQPVLRPGETLELDDVANGDYIVQAYYDNDGEWEAFGPRKPFTVDCA